MTATVIFLWTTGVLFIVSLSAYATHLVLKVRHQKRRISEARAESRKVLRDGVQQLTGAVLQNQISLTEACIRIKLHLDHLEENASSDPCYEIFYRVFDATAHIPTHKQYRALSADQQWKFDQERVAIETLNRDEIIAACRELKKKY